MHKKYTYLIIILLIVSTCVAFSRIANNSFINLDDQGYITQNKNIQSGFSLQTIKWAFSAVVVSNWHPLTLLSHMLDCTIFGLNASAHHIVSMLMHIGTAIFLFLFLFRTTNSLWPAALVAAFFSLHPLRVESVAWASERKDVLSMLLGMMSIYAYAFYVESSKLSKYFLSLTLFALSLMSKSMLVTLPFILLLLDYWPLERWQKVIDAPSKKRFYLACKLIWEKIPYIFLTIAVSIISLWAQNKGGSVASDSLLPLPTRIANAIVSYTNYLIKIIYPVNLSVYYPYNFFLPPWKILISAIIILFISAIVIYYVRKLPFLFVGWLWYLGTLVPVIGFVQIGTQSMADRYTYLPSIGIAIMMSWGILHLIKNENLKIIMSVSMIAALIAMSVLTWRQCGYWKNSLTLFNHALHVTKNNHVAHNRLAAYLAEKGNSHAAIYHFDKALSIKEQPPLVLSGTYIERGNTYAKLSMYQLAMEDYNKAIRIEPDLAEYYYARGTAYGKLMGQYRLAMDDFNKAIHLKSDYAEAYNNRGIVWTKLGSNQKAIDDFNEAIRLKPNYADAWNNMSFTYFSLGNKELGCSSANKACKLGNCIVSTNAKNRGLCN